MSSNFEPNAPNPHLKSVLASEPPKEFSETKQKAIRTLNSTADDDILAIWFQAIGDGSPINPTQTNQIEHAIPDQVMYTAGYNPDLSREEIVPVAIRLFNQHLCQFNGPNESINRDNHRQQARETFREAIRVTTDITSTCYPDAPVSFDELPFSRSIIETQQSIISTLSEEDLSLYWLQVMTETESMMMSISEGEATAEMIDDRPIEHFRGFATRDERILSDLIREKLAQHEYFTASTAEMPVSEFTSQSVNAILESDHLIEILLP